MVFGVFTELCNLRHKQIENVFVIPKRNPVLISSPFTFSPPSPRPIAITSSLYVCLDVPIFGISSKWNQKYMAFSVWLLSFLWLTVLSYGYTTIVVYSLQLMDIWVLGY